jgi:Ca2+-binding RTX toxin-like protein
MSDRLNFAILSMDAYHRGYDAAITGLNVSRTVNGVKIVEKIGNASILETELPTGSESAGFYAIAYSYNGVKTIAYRGTDFNGIDPRDPIHGFPLGGGVYQADQAELAIKFYRAVVGTNAAGVARNPYNAPIVTTGHSLGGGLAGYVASLYGKNAWLYDTMAYTLGAELANTAATGQAAIGDPFGLKADIYGQYAIKPINTSGIRAAQIRDQFLDLPGFVGGTILGLGTDTYDIGEDNFIASDLNTLGVGKRHSQALLVSRIYADESITQNDWKNAYKPLWKAYFNEEVAKALPSAMARTNLDTGSYLGTMQSAIAYSAIKGGERPFGDTGIDAMFDDAGDLGKVIKPDNAAKIVKDHADDIANVFVQYAGGLALNKVTGGVNSKAADGVLKLATDQSTLAIDFGDTLWTKIGAHDTIVGRQEILDAVLDQQGDTDSDKDGTIDSIAQVIAAGMKDAYDDEKFADAEKTTINRILLPTTDDTVTATLEKRDGTGKQTLFVSGSGDDRITGTTGNEIIYGGAGVDRINGGGGVDLVYGGAGNDEIDGGENADFLFGGTGVDVVKGGAGNDRIYADLDGEDDMLFEGGTGTDTIVYRFETPHVESGYGGGWTSDATIELTSTTNGAKASMADFGLKITGLPDGGFGNDALTTIEMATVEAGSENDTLKIASDAKVTEGMIIDLGGGDNLIDLSNQTKTVTVDLSNNLVQVSPRGSARTITVIGATMVLGGSGEDQLTAGTGSGLTYYRMEGGIGADTIVSLAGSDLLFGDAGDDIVSGGAGDDNLSGGDDNDTLNGDDGNDFLSGDNGIDTLHGGNGNDSILGGDDGDLIYGDDGNDMLDGGAGLDRIWGGVGNDVIGSLGFYTSFNDGDIVYGGAGNDGIYVSGGGEAYGEEGDDSLGGNFNAAPEILASLLDGGAGNDYLSGGLGDRLIGGAGADYFTVGPGAIIIDLSLEDIAVDLDSRNIKGGDLQSDGTYYDFEENIRYEYSGSDLIVSNGTRYFTIKDFINGAAGIMLGGSSLAMQAPSFAADRLPNPGAEEFIVNSEAPSRFWSSGTGKLTRSDSTSAISDVALAYDVRGPQNGQDMAKVGVVRTDRLSDEWGADLPRKQWPHVGSAAFSQKENSEPISLDAESARAVNLLVQAMSSFGAKGGIDDMVFKRDVAFFGSEIFVMPDRVHRHGMDGGGFTF